MRFGAVFKNRKCYVAVLCFHVSYDAVRCVFQKSGILRCGSVRFSEIANLICAVRCCDKSYCAVRCGSPLNGFCYGAGPIPVGKTVRNRFFSTVHRMNKPYKTAVSCGSQAFARGTNETAVSLRCTV